MKTLKLRLYPNKTQTDQLNQHCGSCRYIYNWGLEKKIAYYQKYQKSIHLYELQKQVTQLKKEELPWLNDINSQSLQHSLVNLEKAFVAFFKKRSKFPKFKSKKNYSQSFCVPQNFKVDFDNKLVKLPKIGWIRFRDKLNFKNYGAIHRIVVKQEGNEYYACVTCDSESKKLKGKPKFKTAVGIDLGLKTFCTLSNGEKIDKPNFIKKSLDKIKQYQKDKDWDKFRATNKKVSRQRKDFLHKLSSSIVDNQDYKTIVIEDMDVSSIVENGFKDVNRAVMDAGWRSFIAMLEYKCEENGKHFVVISPFEAASRTCVCGKKNSKLTLKDRTWQCEYCHETHDRDILAANNIKLFGTSKKVKAGTQLRTPTL